MLPRPLWVWLGLLLIAPSIARAREAPARVAILADGATAEVERRLLLEEGHERTSSIADASLIVVLGARLEPERLQALYARVRAGAGLLLCAGRDPLDLAPLGLRGTGVRNARATVMPRPGVLGHRLLTEEVVWPSAPQVGRRLGLERSAGSPLQPLIVEDEGAKRAGTPVLLLGKLGAGRVAVLSLDLGDPSNREIVLWPYFNYLLHALGSELLGVPAEPFARWKHSPVPGMRTLVILLAGLVVAWLVTLALFFRARRYSRAHPEILEKFFQRAEGIAHDARAGAEASLEARSAPHAGAKQPSTTPTWSRVGFARPLAGFLTLTAAMFVLFAPYYYVTNILIPNDVQPFPQAKGMWDFAWEALQIAWFLFDAGTFVAFVKYFAEFRLKEPAEALRSTQFFVWWQILTGLVQVTMAGLVAVLILPHTRYGFSSSFVILIALSQYPGFFGVVTFFFQAYQRFDYNIALDLLSDWVLRFALQIPFVLLGRAWGVANPEYGEAFGAAIGIGVGFYVSTIVTFLIGIVLYRRLGLRLGPLFLAHFDRKTAWRMLRYGSKVVAGQALFRAATTVDRVAISVLLLGYTEWLGIQGQIHNNLMFLFPIAYRFFETAMAALSESHGNKKPVLTQYYIARFLQMGFLYTAIGMSLLWALGPTFIREAMDPQWARAADYIAIAAAIGAFYAPAWLSDMLQKGAGRPGLFAWVLGLEQLFRIGLFFVLIPVWGFRGYYLALLCTIALKVIGAWIVNHLVIVRLRLYPWQMFVAPAIAGLTNFFLLRSLVALLAPSGRLEVIVFFFASSLLSFFVCFFACGLAGGIDRALATELEEAAQMTGPARPLARAFYHVARAGRGLSPLRDRFPVTIHAEAQAEARALEESAR